MSDTVSPDTSDSDGEAARRSVMDAAEILKRAVPAFLLVVDDGTGIQVLSAGSTISLMGMTAYLSAFVDIRTREWIGRSEGVGICMDTADTAPKGV